MRRLKHLATGIVLAAGVLAWTVILYAAASYPSSVKTFATRTNGQTISATWFNDIQLEVTAIEGGLLNGFAHALIPSTDGGQNLGSTAKHWSTAYINTLNLNGTSFVQSIPAGLACGRLTLTTAVPVTTGDVTAATTLYYTPIGSCNQITLYNGTNNIVDTLTEISIAVPATTSQMYDVFVYDASGTPTLELLAWTNDTTRATAITLQNGYYAKAATPARRYVGSFRTTTVSGQTESSCAKQYVWNYYNRVRRCLQLLESTASWNYTTATIRQARATATNQVDTVVGVADTPIWLTLSTLHSNTNTGVFIVTGIGVGSTTTISSQGGSATTAIAGGFVTLFSTYQAVPAVGRQFYSWNEYSAATGTTTFYNSGGVASTLGLTGWIEG